MSTILAQNAAIPSEKMYIEKKKKSPKCHTEPSIFATSHNKNSGIRNSRSFYLIGTLMRKNEMHENHLPDRGTNVVKPMKQINIIYKNNSKIVQF